PAPRLLAARPGRRPGRGNRGAAQERRGRGPPCGGGRSSRRHRGQSRGGGERDRVSDTLSQDGTASLLPEAELEDDVLVRVDNLVKHFPVKAGGLIGRTVGHVQAVDGVSLTIRRGQTLGLLGQTGCGKSPGAPLIAR